MLAPSLVSPAALAQRSLGLASRDKPANLWRVLRQVRKPHQINSTPVRADSPKGKKGQCASRHIPISNEELEDLKSKLYKQGCSQKDCTVALHVFALLTFS